MIQPSLIRSRRSACGGGERAAFENVFPEPASSCHGRRIERESSSSCTKRTGAVSAVAPIRARTSIVEDDLLSWIDRGIGVIARYPVQLVNFADPLFGPRATVLSGAVGKTTMFFVKTGLRLCCGALRHCAPSA